MMINMIYSENNNDNDDSNVYLESFSQRVVGHSLAPAVHDKSDRPLKLTIINKN